MITSLITCIENSSHNSSNRFRVVRYFKMFKGRIALVTGGAGGIGLDYAKQLLQNEIEGITIVDIDGDRGKEVEKTLNKEFGGNRVIFLQCDISQKQQFENAFKASYARWNGLDILINNAGYGNENNWEKSISINCTGTTHGTYLGFEYMSVLKNGKGGTIVNVSSTSGVHHYSFIPSYSASKAYLISFTRAVGTELYYNFNRVKLITVCPGLTNTSATYTGADVVLTDFCPILASVMDEQLNLLKPQSSEYLAKSVIDLIDQAKNGSVWVIEGEERPYEI